MDNAAEALKMAGFVFIFSIALSVAMFTIMKSKKTSEDVIKYSDKSMYVSNIELSEEDKKSSNRIVSVYDIIPTLYRYRQEKYIILFCNNDESSLKILDQGDNIKQNGEKISYLNLEIDNYYNEEWMIDQDHTNEHVDKIAKYLIDNYSDNKFEEELTETYNMYLNNANVKTKDEEKSLSKDIRDGLNKDYNNEEDITDKDPIRVIRYRLKN